jgi:hypothetical protein
VYLNGFDLLAKVFFRVASWRPEPTWKDRVASQQSEPIFKLLRFSIILVVRWLKRGDASRGGGLMMSVVIVVVIVE